MSELMMCTFSTATLYTHTELAHSPSYIETERALSILECRLDKLNSINKLKKQLVDCEDNTDNMQ